MEEQLITPNETKEAISSPNGAAKPELSTEPKKPNSGIGLIVLISVLMLIIGGVIGYFVTITYFPVIKTVEVPIFEDTNLSTDVSADINWKEESEQAVDAYLGYFSLSGPTITGVGKIKCSEGQSTTECTALKELRTAMFNQYLSCLVNSANANNVESGLIINYDPVLGVQDGPKSHEIVNAYQEGDKVTVITKMNYDTQTIDLNFFLTYENNKWLINATDVSNKFNASEYGCSQFATK